MGNRLYPPEVQSKRARDSYVIERAYECADMGRFCNWLDIEQHLIGKGFTTARYLLDGEPIRVALDRQCARAILKRKKDAEQSGIPFKEPTTPLQFYDPMSKSAEAVRNQYVVEAEKEPKA